MELDSWNSLNGSQHYACGETCVGSAFWKRRFSIPRVAVCRIAKKSKPEPLQRPLSGKEHGCRWETPRGVNKLFPLLEGDWHVTE